MAYSHKYSTPTEPVDTYGQNNNLYSASNAHSQNQYPSNQYDDYQGEEIEKKPRSKCYRCCCCCCLTRRGTLACSLFLLLLIGGIAAAVYFLWPRIPQFQFKQFTYQDGSPITSNLGNRIQNNNNVITLPISLAIDYVNDNYIPIYVKDVIIDTKLNGKNSGSSHLNNPINFPGRSAGPANIPLNLSFDLTNPKSVNLESLQVLLQSCSPDASQRKPIKVDYSATLILPIISWTGYKPNFSGTQNFDCPWDLNSVLSGTGVNLGQILGSLNK